MPAVVTRERVVASSVCRPILQLLAQLQTCLHFSIKHQLSLASLRISRERQKIQSKEKGEVR